MATPREPADRQFRRATRLALWAAALATGACVQPPERRSNSPLDGARRVLQRDFGPTAAARQEQQIHRWQGQTAAELRRVERLPAGLAPLASDVQRAAALPNATRRLLAMERGRVPRLPSGMLPTPVQFEQAIAGDLDTALLLLGGPHRPMGEIDDRRHRTDPADDRPEATWWQRLRRRLQL